MLDCLHLRDKLYSVALQSINLGEVKGKEGNVRFSLPILETAVKQTDDRMMSERQLQRKQVKKKMKSVLCTRKMPNSRQLSYGQINFHVKDAQMMIR